MGRKIIAVVVGYIAMALLLFITFTVLYLILGTEGSFKPGSFEVSTIWVICSIIVSFGAAPAFLIYKTHLYSYEIFGVLIASSLVLAGGFRLARFNVQLVGFDKNYFSGLPIPISAITISSFILSYYEMPQGFSPPFSEMVLPLVIILSLIMVSKIKYDTIPRPTKEEFKKNPFLFLIILFGAIAAILTSGKAIFFIFVLFILFGIFRYIFTLFVKRT